MAEYDIEGARAAGIADSDIAATLAPKLNYDLEGARKAGIAEKDIADALARKYSDPGNYRPPINPNLQAQGDKAHRDYGDFGAMDIAGAGAVGGALGFASPEIMRGLGAAARAFPQTAGIAPALENAGLALRGAGRFASSLSGAASGAAGETSGQVAEMAGAGPTTAELARIAGGAVGPELKSLAWAMAKKSGDLPLVSHAVDYIREKLVKNVKLTAAQEQYLQGELAALRGGAGDSDLSAVGSILGDKGRNILSAADIQMANAVRGSPAGLASYPPQPREMADIGESLRGVINTRNQAALEARQQQYSQNEKLRDSIVSQREKSGSYINSMPEYQDILRDLKSQLETQDVMKRSPSVQAGYAKLMNELSNPSQDVFGQPKPVSFQAIDDVRRKLGDVFRGKPDEGYSAISAATAKDLYGRLSDIQRKFAGGPNGPQARLLDEYAASTEGLQPFSSTFGKKTTALDQYREGQYATDASSLPASYFKTRASITALKELTGDVKLVNGAALDFADKQLSGKSADQVRKWLGENSEWIGQVPVVQNMVDRYATRLETFERSNANAQAIRDRAVKQRDFLVGNNLDAQRAVDMIRSGDVRYWDQVAPAIAQSPQAKTQMVNAVRLVLSEQASAVGTINLFNRNIRPFLEKTGIAGGQELDVFAQKLANIRDKNIPEPEKLSRAKQVLMNGTAGWLSSAVSRAGGQFGTWMIPD